MDIGYTAPQAIVVPEHAEYIALALDYCTATDHLPPGERFCWTCEVSWTVKAFLAQYSARAEEFFRRVHEGRVEVTGLYLQVTDLFAEPLLAQTLDYADTPGAVLRPGVDQVPGMTTDWHGIQRYFAVSGCDMTTVVASPDVPLVQVNPRHCPHRTDASNTQSKKIDYAGMSQPIDSDTIAAIATAPGAAAIGIVRLSGPAALTIADQVFRTSAPEARSSTLHLPSTRPANTFVHGYVVDAAGAVVDDVLMLLFRAPHSYTGEDAVELQGHGGAIATRRVLRAVLDAGARSAQPGEFTKRAFLNGRLDLVQAEAVLDLICARSDAAASAAREQLDGILSHSLAKLYDGAMTVAADLEATLDFVEHELPEAVLKAIPQRIQAVADAAKTLLAGWHEGRILREGAMVVIAGPPNAGKSTLFNQLLGHERTIVHQQPGTTRDLVEEALVLQGLPIRLVDSAGLRETTHDVENEGIRRARACLQAADLVLYVLDTSIGMSGDDRAVMDAIPPDKFIIVLNKHDLLNPHKHHLETQAFFPENTLSCSAKTGFGLDALRLNILTHLQADLGRLSHAAVSERHASLLQTAIDELRSAEAVMTATPDQAAFAADHLRTAIESLGEITGRTYHTDLLNAVFARFCVGK